MKYAIVTFVIPVFLALSVSAGNAQSIPFKLPFNLMVKINGTETGEAVDHFPDTQYTFTYTGEICEDSMYVDTRIHSLWTISWSGDTLFGSSFDQNGFGTIDFFDGGNLTMVFDYSHHSIPFMEISGYNGGDSADANFGVQLKDFSYDSTSIFATDSSSSLNAHCTQADYVFSSANDGYRNLQSTSSIDLSGIFKPTVLYATSGVITSSGNPSESQGHIFPNPSTGGFTIVPPDGGGEISRIDLLDEAGHVVADLTRSVVSDADGIHVKSGGLAAGTYFVRVEAKGGEYLYKIVIDHGVK